jgi:hypothetical protein
MTMTDQPAPYPEVMLDDSEPEDNGNGEVVAVGDDPSYEWPDDTPTETHAAVAANWEDFRSRAMANRFDADQLLDGVEKVYSTAQAAAFFGRSNQWIYWGLRKDAKTGEQVFSYRDGRPILPVRVGKMGKRRFTLPIIREIALACFRRGNLTEEELETIMAKILLAEFGRRAFAEPR